MRGGPPSASVSSRVQLKQSKSKGRAQKTPTHSLKIQDRGSYSKKLGELLLVDSDSARREEHTCIGHSSG